MTGDNPVSMPHGPVLSTTYDHMNWALPSAEGGWESWIADREGHLLDLRNRAQVKVPDSLLELSDADIEVLEETWQRFGRMDQWELRDWTHANCPEWHDPQGSSNPIAPEELLAALKFSREQVEAIIARMREADAVNRAFGGPLQKHWMPAWQPSAGATLAHPLRLRQASLRCLEPARVLSRLRLAAVHRAGE